MADSAKEQYSNASETVMPAPATLHDLESLDEGIWSAIKEALRGSHRNYTVGPIGRSILLLAIPMVLEMIMESVFAVVDIFWVAHLGTDAAATVGITESLLTLIYALAMGLSIGATATVARPLEPIPTDCSRWSCFPSDMSAGATITSARWNSGMSA